MYDQNIIHSNFLITFAGTPPTKVLGDTSFVTTDPAAMIDPLPIVTPPNIVTFAPIQHPSCMIMSLKVLFPALLNLFPIS